MAPPVQRPPPHARLGCLLPHAVAVVHDDGRHRAIGRKLICSHSNRRPVHQHSPMLIPPAASDAAEGASPAVLASSPWSAAAAAAARRFRISLTKSSAHLAEGDERRKKWLSRASQPAVRHGGSGNRIARGYTPLVGTSGAQARRAAECRYNGGGIPSRSLGPRIRPATRFPVEATDQSEQRQSV